MSEGWGLVFLGAIAAATLTMAAVQVGGIWYLSRLGRRLERMADRLEAELEPTLARLRAVGDEAARIAHLATVQMERVDRVAADLAARIDETTRLLQRALIAPARESLAVVRALKAAVAAFRQVGRRSRPPVTTHEPEEALFIG